ncbi:MULTISPECIES: arginine-ornithine antiporter [unclassified Lactobacillus]|uniref:arginine-ornithine antiporter n=1 Tax=unclassified Lactobacillus TaxID=2620435 RepID=UPI000EFB6159|nr:MULTISPECIES: arginine-ornithine antiporter [unclassified Lactobacillus]RMC38738.1 arginine-ornithine antiporter [Lactobacillus sp. ESL0237]RMC43083.1 arginine-ornithine antiporter [Lactobacillus sp. ESL0234]RMC43937.1 arginine-ornithine antiporter [Lactobacillus sp. ESL0236]RMC44940.1 arginine-ornithine antiporter [Lactobacillus sp. ESL0230]
MTDSKEQGIALPALVALVVSSAIGSGIFDLPSTLAQAATPGAALLAWVITGIGILTLSLSLNNLVLTKPDLTGVSDYARAGFGDFAGFISGWGYWLSAWLGNVAFATMLMSSLGYFFPPLKSGNSISAIIVASIISWALTILVTQGIESAAVINAIVTITKMIPIFAFIVIALITFKAGIFTSHFWANMSTNLMGKVTYTAPTRAGIFSQIKGCIMVMMWVFVGIEGATTMAARAKKKSDAGKATIIGLFSLLSIYIVVSILPYGYLPLAKLQTMRHPVLLYLFKEMTGPIGGAFIAVGLIISILGAWLSWTMLPVEATSLMAEQGLLPNWFGKLNKHRAPANSLWLTEILIQLFLITLLFTDQAYNFAYSLCTSSIAVCYALVGAYELKLGLENRHQSMIWCGLIALVFEVVGMIFAGLQYLWLCTIAYVIGFVLYYRARKENNHPISKIEWIFMIIIGLLALTAIIALILGKLKA